MFSSITHLSFFSRTGVGVLDPWDAPSWVNLEELLMLYTTATTSKYKVGRIIGDAQFFKENDILPGVRAVPFFHIALVLSTRHELVTYSTEKNHLR